MILPQAFQESKSSFLKSESEIMMTLSIERKGQNYTLLRGWDQMRAQRLAIHRKTIDQLQQYTEASLQLSTNYINVVKHFLSDKYDQFIKYSKYPLGQPNIDNNNPLVSLVYRQTSQVLLKLHEDSKSYQQNALSMAIIIEALLKKVENELQESDSELITMKQEVYSLSEQLLEANDEASETCGNLSDVYHKDKSGNTFKSKEDFYALSQIFMLIAQEQTQIQNELGKKTIDFFKWGEETKAKRHQFLKNILIQYYTKHQQMHKYQASSQILQQIKNDHYNKDQCQVEDILDRQLRKDVNRMMGEEDKKISMEDLYSYIMSLSFTKFDPRNLILKQTKVIYKNTTGEEFQKYIIITVDGFLHFCVQKTIDSNTVWTIKLDKTVKIKQLSETELEITKSYSSGSLLRNLLHLKKDSNTLSICIVFDSGDHMQQFCEFVDKILI